jgi:alkylated DNA repair dioxygenase AlkB
MPEQLSLLGRTTSETAAPLDFAALRRIDLDADSWLEYGNRFVLEHETLFESLRASVRFRRDTRLMYEREVDIPRAFASLPEDGPIPPMLRAIQQALAERYHAQFERIGVAYYQNGDDSVAFHRDHVARDRPTLVAIVSLGTPRKLLVRKFGGGPARAFKLGWGDLFVMGGMCQADWEHGIPKQKRAEPRMSCVFRHVYSFAGMPESARPE